MKTISRDQCICEANVVVVSKVGDNVRGIHHVDYWGSPIALDRRTVIGKQFLALPPAMNAWECGACDRVNDPFN